MKSQGRGELCPITVSPKPHFMVNSHNLLRQAASVLKVQLARQAGRIVGKEENQLVLGFEKDDWGGWHAVIPTWPGPKAALAMVDGADTFLDMLSEGNDYVALHISVKPMRAMMNFITKLHTPGAMAHTT